LKDEVKDMVKTSGRLQVKSENIFPIIRDNLYQDKDVFVRELISNAADAIKKRRFFSASDNAAENAPADSILVTIDEESHTICFSDTGVGMTAEEVDRYINQIAFSGAVEFIHQNMPDTDNDIVGHFGLGFYSAFMVASVVTIDSLSALPDAKPVHWKCIGESMQYDMSVSQRREAGTSITLQMDDSYFLSAYVMRKVIQKYCGFIPFKIYLQATGLKAPQLVNTPDPIWVKDPKSLQKIDYLRFYHEHFEDYSDPVFWINLFDKKMGVSGILYFRHIDDDAASINGCIKLFSNRVFVEDNLQELIPDYLLLQNGIVNVDNLTLNVSRSSLRNDGYAAAVRRYLTEQVGHKIQQLYNTEFNLYCQLWKEIGPAIKIGLLQDRMLKKLVKDIILYETISGELLTLAQYREQNAVFPGQVFYVSDEIQQLPYIRLLEAAGVLVVKLTHVVDQPFIQMMELDDKELKFRRIDADIPDVLRESHDAGQNEKQNQAVLKAVFSDIIDQQTTTMSVERLKSPHISALILLDEKLRRTKEAMELYSLHQQIQVLQMNCPLETLIINMSNPLVQSIMITPHAETSILLARQIYDLARLSHESMNAGDIADFVERTHLLMQRMVEQA